MIYKYRIFQLPRRAEYKFMSFDYAMENGLSREDYVSVYGDTIEAKTVNSTLEHLFAIHNSDCRPNGRGMHSLSVSDVVTLNGKPYYCNVFGWSEIPADKWM